MSIAISTSSANTVSVSVNNIVAANFTKSSSSISVIPPAASSTILTAKSIASIQVVT